MAVILFANSVTVANVEELDDSPQESWEKSGRFNATRKLKVPWADRNTLARQLLGNRVTLPQSYPDRSTALARSVEIDHLAEKIVNAGSGSAATINTYEHAVLTVRYADPEPGSAEDPQTLATESLEPSAEFITLPADNLHWGSATGPLLKDAEAPGRIIAMVDWVYKRNRVPFVNSAMFALQSHCNQAEVTSLTLGVTFPAETLLYSTISLEREIYADGADAWSVTFRFTYREPGWNVFWRADLNAWVSIYHTDGTLIKPIPTGNFRTLTA